MSLDFNDEDNISIENKQEDIEEILETPFLNDVSQNDEIIPEDDFEKIKET